MTRGGSKKVHTRRTSDVNLWSVVARCHASHLSGPKDLSHAFGAGLQARLRAWRALAHKPVGAISECLNVLK